MPPPGFEPGSWARKAHILGRTRRRRLLIFIFTFLVSFLFGCICFLRFVGCFIVVLLFYFKGCCFFIRLCGVCDFRVYYWDLDCDVVCGLLGWLRSIKSPSVVPIVSC